MSTSQHLVIALVAAVAVIAVVRFEALCLRDIAHTDDRELRYMTRTAWIVVCLISIPIGGIVYLFCGKQR